MAELKDDMTYSQNAVPPASTALLVVNSWNALRWGHADLSTPYLALVGAYGKDEAHSLIHLALEAQRASDPGYELYGIESYVRRQIEEAAEEKQ